MPFYDRRIETVILTHDESDHSFGLSLVRERYNVLHFEPKLIKGDRVKMGGVEFRVEWPDKEIPGKENIEAIVGRVEYGSFSVLLTSDTPSEYYPDQNGVEVVKVPHHGSKTGFEKEWWAITKPSLAIISVGKNSYGHPVPEVIKSISDLGI
jgi:competence protein ComEC